MLLLIPTVGCADLLGFGEYDASTGTGGAGAASAGGTGGTGGTTSTGGTGGTGGTTGTGGTGGTGGTAGTGGTGGIGGTGGTGGSTATECVPAVELCTTANVDEDCDGLPKCTGAHRWSGLLGGSAGDQALSVATDQDGNVVLGGVTASPMVDFGDGPNMLAGQTDLFVVKLDPQGKLLWSRTFGSAGNDTLTAVAVGPGGAIFVAGHGGAIEFTGTPLAISGPSDAFVAKLDPDGKVIWATAYGGPDVDEIADIAVGADGDVAVTGGYKGAGSFGGVALAGAGAAAYNVLVAKVHGDDAMKGAVIWAKGFGDTMEQYGRSVAIDPAMGDIVVATDITGVAGFGGGPLTSKGLTDIAVVKLTGADGGFLWHRLYGDAANQFVFKVKASPDGFVLAGHVAGAVDFDAAAGGETSGGADLDVVVWKLDPAGTFKWVQRGAGAGAQYAWGLAVDSTGFIVVTGSFEGTFDFGNCVLPAVAQAPFDRYVMKLGPGGGCWWRRTFPNSVSTLTSVATDGLARVVLAGGLLGATDFGGGLLDTGTNGTDIVVTGLAP